MARFVSRAELVSSPIGDQTGYGRTWFRPVLGADVVEESGWDGKKDVMRESQVGVRRVFMFVDVEASEVGLRRMDVSGHRGVMRDSLGAGA